MAAAVVFVLLAVLELTDGGGGMKHGPMKQHPMPHGQMNHGPMNQGPMNQGPMKHGQMPHGQMPHGPMKQGPMPHGPMKNGEMSSPMPGKVPYKMPDNKPEEVPDEKPEQVPDEKPEQVSDEKPEAVPDEKPEEVPDEKPEQVPDEKPEEVPDKKPEEVPDEKPEQVPDEKPEEVPDEKPEEVPDEKPEQVPDEKPEEVPDEKPEEVPDEKPEEVPDEKLEEVPDEKPEEVPDKMPEEVPDKKLGTVQEKKPENKPEEKQAPNIARGGTATQSSTRKDMGPERAIDGNPETNNRKGSCTHTQKDDGPWWRLDLKREYTINNVTIFNRGDCCHKRLYGAEIRIGNSLTDNGNANPICSKIKEIGQGEGKTSECNGMVGRYINIWIPGRKQFLTLCEVEVTGEPTPDTPQTAPNIARGGTATQSSTRKDMGPERAIDGNPETNNRKGSCTHTKKDDGPWWRLDLKREYTINNVTIFNRGDCCHKRLYGAEIRIGNSLTDNGNANPICSKIKEIGQGEGKTSECNGMVGRYINIWIPGRKQFLTLCEVEVTGEPTPDTPQTAPNIARGGTATQSSTRKDMGPERAIDGNPETNNRKGSCTHTKKDDGPWWRLDLKREYTINNVTIFNRGDCCHKRLYGAEIRIGNSLTDNGNANPICDKIKEIGQGEGKTSECNGMVGRYINIWIPGRKQFLTLCEVEVTGEPTPDTPQTAPNIARGGTATQSSTRKDMGPERAIDGNPETNNRKGSCTHTKKDDGPWWRLDLKREYTINNVTIFNRGDCCHKRLYGAEIRIGNSLTDNGNANPICSKIKEIGQGEGKTSECNGMVGRYINIWIPGRKQFLTLCEVEVTGEPTPDTPQTAPNIARGGTATQSSTRKDMGPERAIDGNPETNNRKGSCTHTKKDDGPWWRLDLKREYTINNVTIFNRGDCCHKRLYGAEIRIGNSLTDNGNANPICDKIKEIGQGEGKTSECNGMVGRYINIWIPGRKQFLTLCEVEVTGEPTPDTPQTAPNIARGGTATQSSTRKDMGPERAIDGNPETNNRKGSCTHTKKDDGPWWRLDLKREYTINNVTIFNRGDCCHKRLYGAEIRIGNSLTDNGNANPICSKIKEIGQGEGKTSECNGMVGRYINIWIPGRKQFLTLCEVEVTGEPTPDTPQTAPNIARGGTATQSSTRKDMGPERAIDGNPETNNRKGSCTHTKKDDGPWWRLDLKREYTINNVTIFNRGDCCHKRLYGAEIRIGNSLTDNGNANPICDKIKEIGQGEGKTSECNGMVGRYINIWIPGRKQFLTLCEVEVTGEPTPDTPQTAPNIARGGTATQSSTRKDMGPERAIDGNPETNNRKGSCTHTKKDDGPWWRLDLKREYTINNVTIFNRGDCCHKRLYGAEIRIGNSLTDNGNANPICSKIKEIGQGEGKTSECNGMVGRYINIWIPGRKQFLTLCEVEVTGEPTPDTPQTAPNIARGGTATQSSTRKDMGPERAIDGNPETNNRKGSCTHTKKDDGPWWRLDLKREYTINNVTIFNRGDCCHKRLYGAEIRIGNSLTDNGNANPICDKIKEIGQGEGKTSECNGMVGRYINIWIPGRKQFLTLCEVEVTGEPTPDTPQTAPNIALGGHVTQSSIHRNGVPERAIDGNSASQWAQGSCTLTEKEYMPWWRLNLGRRYKISTVTVTIPQDCCHKRIKYAEIHIGDSLHFNGNANPRCTEFPSMKPGGSKTFSCDGMEGRYINIVVPDKIQSLSLCEVEVTGTETKNDSEEYVCS